MTRTLRLIAEAVALAPVRSGGMSDGLPNLTRSSWWLVAAGAFAVMAAKLTGVI